MTRLHLLLKVSNVFVYLFFLSSTVYSIFGPNPDKETLEKHLTYLTPSGWVHYVWSAIHVLLGGFIIAQWFDVAEAGVVHGVGWHFTISTLLNAAWLVLWHKGHLVLSLIAILLTASSVSFVFYNLESNYPATNWTNRLFVHAPFSLWHGWVVYAATLSVFATFTSVQKHGPDTFHIIISLIGILFLGSTAIGYVEFKKQKGDILGAIVLAWGLYGIAANQHNPWIHWFAFAEGLIATLYCARPFVARLLGRSTSESAPLLG
jgi:hypothetical protein